MSISIRRATPADAAAIANVHKLSWEVAYQHLLSPKILEERSLPAVQARWEKPLSDGRTDVYVAEHPDSRVVGFASAGKPKDEDAQSLPVELYLLHVLPDFYGGGVAKRLLNAAIGDSDACLYFIDGNTRAEAFYAKNGFKRDGKTKVDWEFWGGREVVEARVVRIRA